jgi:hypothetical protein
MQKHSLLLILLSALFGCVQPSYEKTVVVTLTVPGIKGIETVGVRGEGNPLNWRKDFPLTAVVPDSLYTATITGRTAYDFIDIKFTVNGHFELEGKENRRVVFNKSDTTYYHAVFDRNQEN